MLPLPPFVDLELIPHFGNRPVAEIRPTELLSVIRKIERRDAAARAHKVLNIAGPVLRYAVSTGRLAGDTSRDLRGALKRHGELCPRPYTRKRARVKSVLEWSFTLA